MYSSFTKIKHILTFHPTSLEQFLRAIWGAVSQTTVLIVPQTTNLQLSLFAFFCEQDKDFTNNVFGSFFS